MNSQKKIITQLDVQIFSHIYKIFFKGIIILASLSLINLEAKASSPEAWEKHQQEVISKCFQASKLRNPQPVGKIILFSDEVGYDALSIKGHYQQPHMNNQKTQVLCLFNRRTRKAYIGEK
ncbi:hypothetical protein Sta7437_2844 [Stanieria cyanosphaera PCC 7437]|uniref:Uncharacterized protein n=1 Tax=Stanieria cyanosphaera (strain ATCC 29371 / PCC 7437) TaxID=111780 RepID=K9XUT5_STAC7|nr:hypothetical protein [Stanieria cyanosphaera]AFZ36365.1 hypothetical protein Sta7437_2844 [Stanieria cyanosphaera PCC 7437]